MAHDVFISYSHYDKAVADAVCAYFEQNGLRCWYAPRDIAPGEDWANSIIRAIESSKVMALIFTKDSNLSKQVLREVSNACRAGVTVIPFRLADIEPVAGMMYYLSTVHWLDAMNDELDEAVKNLYVLSRSIVDKMNEFPDAPKPVAPAAEGVQSVGMSAAADKDKKKKKLTAIISAAAAVAVIGIAAGIMIAVNSTKPSADDNKTSSDSGRTADVIQYDDPDSQEETRVYNIGATTTAEISFDFDDTYSSGNTQGNMIQGGYLAADDEWYYYRSNDEGKMYKMTLSGRKKTQLTDEEAWCIAVIDEHIYYMSLHGVKRMNKDGSDVKQISDLFANTMMIYNDRIYLIDFGAVTSMAMDGSNVIEYGTILDELWGIAFDGKYFYYTPNDNERYLYRVDPETKEKECILKDMVGNITIAGNYLIYYDFDCADTYAYDLTTGERTVVFDDQLLNANAVGGFIYGTSYNMADSALIRVDLKKGTFNRLSNFSDLSRVNICGDKVLFESVGELYFVNTDGMDLQRVE